MDAIPLNEPIFQFSEVLDFTGAENAWLRTLLQRDKSGSLGTKHRTGRLMFSLWDIGTIALMWRLSRLGLAPTGARAVMDALVPMIQNSKPGELPARIFFVGDEAGRHFVWTEDKEGKMVTWSPDADADAPATYLASRFPHLVIPKEAIFSPISAAVETAKRWQNSPEGEGTASGGAA